MNCLIMQVMEPWADIKLNHHLLSWSKHKIHMKEVKAKDKVTPSSLNLSDIARKMNSIKTPPAPPSLVKKHLKK